MTQAPGLTGWGKGLVKSLPPPAPGGVRGARGYKAASVAVPVGGRDKSQRLPVLCCQRAKIDRGSTSQKGPAWAWARLLSVLGLETADAGRVAQSASRPAPLPLPPETRFHRERKGWPSKWLLGPTPLAGPPGVSGCESCGDFAGQAPHRCWAAGPWD